MDVVILLKLYLFVKQLYNFALIIFILAARTRADAVPRHSERGDRAAVPAVQGDQAGEHPRRGYCRR